MCKGDVKCVFDDMSSRVTLPTCELAVSSRERERERAKEDVHGRRQMFMQVNCAREDMSSGVMPTCKLAVSSGRGDV
jgi:hypothetical protein